MGSQPPNTIWSSSANPMKSLMRRGAIVGALPQPNSVHLSEASDRLCQTLLGEQDAGDGRGGHGSHTGKKYAEASLGGTESQDVLSLFFLLVGGMRASPVQRYARCLLVHPKNPSHRRRIRENGEYYDNATDDEAIPTQPKIRDPTPRRTTRSALCIRPMEQSRPNVSAFALV